MRPPILNVVRRSRRYASSNLARNALAETKTLSEAVLRNWLSYLLDHLNTVPDHLWLVKLAPWRAGP